MSAQSRGKGFWTEPESSGTRTSLSSQGVVSAAELTALVNSYSIGPSPPRTIVVPNASRLALLQELSVSGILLPKQLVTLDPRTNRRTVASDPAGYSINANDGDLHLDLGVASLQSHITCELQNAKSWLPLFKRTVGQSIVVSGFFRCLFEHPGFLHCDDAHIFEIHPVRAVSIAGKVQSFDVEVPDQKSIHSWVIPNQLNAQDNKVRVKYNPTNDSLTFSGMDGLDENYVRVSGTVSQVQPNTNSAIPATFTFTGPDIGHPIEGISLQSTTAAQELAKLNGSKVTMVALRNIDLAAALKGRYSINLLAIDIQPA